MAEGTRKRMEFVVFDGSPIDQEEVCAVLVTKDDAGELHLWTEAPDGNLPSEDFLGMFKQAVEIANL